MKARILQETGFNKVGSLCLAALLLAVQAATMWYLLGVRAFPLTAVAIGAWLIFTGWRWKVSNTFRFRLSAVLAIMFVLKSRVAPIHVASGSVTSMTQFAHVAAQFFMVLQLIVLSTNDRKLLPQVLPWFGALAMICSGDFLVNTLQRSVFQSLVVVYIMLAAAFSACNRQSVREQSSRSRSLFLAVLLGAVGVLSWVSATTLFTHSKDLESLVSSLVDPKPSQVEAGFSKQGRLESIVHFRQQNSDAVVMRVYGKSSPRYLKGFTFGRFQRRQWMAMDPTVQLRQPDLLEDLPRGAGENVFSVGGAPEVKSKLQIWPVEDNESMLFMPPNPGCVAAAVDHVGVSVADGNVSAPDLPVGYPYTIYASADPRSPLPQGPQRAGYSRTSILSSQPDRTKAHEIADRLLNSEPGLSFDEKVNRVVNFLGQIPYSDDFEVPAGRDPIESFLSTKSGGHCEYFATAAAIILRLGKIPTRYVTGFVVPERNDYGEYWVVRRRYAHAWIEAYDDEREQWIPVEATPGSGVPSDPAPSVVSQLWNYVTDRYQVFRVRLHQRGLLWAVGVLLSSWTVRLLLGLSLVWLFIRIRRWNRATANRGQHRNSDPESRALNKLLDKVDARLRRQTGLIRETNETLFQFAARVTAQHPGSSLPEWYRSYAVARYSPDPDVSVKELAALARSLD